MTHRLPHLAEGLELVNELVHEIKSPLFVDDKFHVSAVQQSVEEAAVVFPGSQVVRYLDLLRQQQNTYIVYIRSVYIRPNNRTRTPPTRAQTKTKTKN